MPGVRGIPGAVLGEIGNIRPLEFDQTRRNQRGLPSSTQHHNWCETVNALPYAFPKFLEEIGRNQRQMTAFNLYTLDAGGLVDPEIRLMGSIGVFGNERRHGSLPEYRVDG